MKVKNFTYNGFSGRLTGGYAEYTAVFKEWTEDPGVAICSCDDGKERLIPTFALERFDAKSHPVQNNENKPFYIGLPCCS